MHRTNPFITLVLGGAEGVGGWHHFLATRVGTQFLLLCPYLYFGVTFVFKPLDVITGPTLH